MIEKTQLVEILELGHIYLKRYKFIAIFIIFFFAWQIVDLTIWWKEHFSELEEWQNVGLLGWIGSYVLPLKWSLEHILSEE